MVQCFSDSERFNVLQKIILYITALNSNSFGKLFDTCRGLQQGNFLKLTINVKNMCAYKS